MKLSRLQLARYGHLTDVELTFPADHRLHVVLGANEAGKSTALAAIGDALYGFPHRTPFAFLHDQSDLRIGFDILAVDGTLHRFARIKRRKDDLTDAEGRPVPESALIALRGPQDRDFFEDMFGLDGKRLREGGNAILGGRGEVGSTIFQASSGLNRVPAALTELKAQADTLYSPRRVASRAFYQAVDAHRTARAELDARTLRGDEYEAKRDERRQLDTTITLNTERERAHTTERRRLERIRRTLPALDGYARASAALAELGPVPSLPSDAQEQQQQATLKRDVAAQTLSGETARRAEIAAARDAITPDEALLREASSIDTLAQKLPVIDTTAGDRELQEAAADQHAAAIERLARDLDLTGTADTIVSKMPTAIARTALRRAVKEQAALAQRLALATEHDAAARREAESAAKALAALPLPPDPAPLARAIDLARAEGRIDEECAHAQTAMADASAACARALAALPLPPWSGGAASLRTAKFPAEPVLRRHQDALAKAENGVRDAAAELDRLDHELATATDRVTEITAGEALPTDHAIATARDLRDHAWRIIRRHHIDGGAVPSAEERAALPPLSLPEAFESLIREADRIADRRNVEAKRISDYEHAIATRDKLVAGRARAVAAHSDAVARHDAALAAWQTEWVAAGFTPEQPAAMRDWLAARRDVLTALAAEEDASRRHLDLVARREAARAALSTHIQVDDDPRLAPLLRAAQAVAAGHTAAVAAYSEASKRDAQGRRSAEEAMRALEVASDAISTWQTGWTDLLATLSLPPETAAEDAEAPLALWESIAAAAQDREAARARIAQMTAAITAFTTQVGQLVARVAPHLVSTEPGAAVAELAGQLQIARDQAAERGRHTETLAKLDTDIAQAEAKHDEAERVLVSLRHLAGVTTDEDLASTITRIGRHAALVTELETHTLNLERQGEGVALPTLQAEAAGQDLDALAIRIDEIDRELAALAETSNTSRQRLGQLDADLARMEAGQNAAEAAQRMEDSAAEAADIASRYARIRLAGALLRAGLDRYRREQQDPLLRRAGEYFNQLTGGRHPRLEVVENDDGAQAIVAMTDDGRRCPVIALSEGARDQLYFALRLAAIEDYADHSPPLPFIADDLLVQFDDDRARAAVAALAQIAARTQVILFTHHSHVAAMVSPEVGHVQTLPPVPAARREPLAAD